jgi:hypothetical protein
MAFGTIDEPARHVAACLQLTRGRRDCGFRARRCSVADRCDRLWTPPTLTEMKASTRPRAKRRNMWNRIKHSIHARTALFASLVALPILAVTSCGAHPLVPTPGTGTTPTPTGRALVDDFTSDSSLDPGLWTTDTSFMRSLASWSSSPPASLVSPQLSFDTSGMRMAGANGLFQTTGVQSLLMFTAPFNVQARVVGTQACGNAFEIFLASRDFRARFKSRPRA